MSRAEVRNAKTTAESRQKPQGFDGAIAADRLTLILALRKRQQAESNPDVRRGLAMAIYQIERGAVG